VHISKLIKICVLIGEKSKCTKHFMYYQFDLYKINVLKKFRLGFQWMNIDEKECHYRLVHLQEKINNVSSIKHEFPIRIN